MRLVYIDEAGTSLHEPVVAVCGVLVDADRSMIAVENYLEALIEEFVPEQHRYGFVFHATDIWSGTSVYKDKDTWPFAKRLDLLERLVSIPAKFDLPVSNAFVQKTEIRKRAERDPRPVTEIQINNTAHVIAFAECCQGVEMMMRQLANDEVALLIAEDLDRMRAVIKEAHSLCRDPRQVTENKLDHNMLLPWRKIKDAVYFATKSESKLLQLADVCAFFFRGYLTGHKHVARFYDALKPQLLIHVHLPG